MTSLDRPITRLTNFHFQGRAIVLRLESGGKIIRVRQKGRRTWHTVAIETIFWQAVRNTAQEVRAARKARREERKKLRLA